MLTSVGQVRSAREEARRYGGRVLGYYGEVIAWAAIVHTMGIEYQSQTDPARDEQTRLEIVAVFLVVTKAKSVLYNCVGLSVILSRQLI
jgi:hypothetical protein